MGPSTGAKIASMCMSITMLCGGALWRHAITAQIAKTLDPGVSKNWDTETVRDVRRRSVREMHRGLSMHSHRTPPQPKLGRSSY